MAFVADDLAAWFIGLLADAGRERLTTFLVGSDQQRALHRAATHAVRLTAEELCPGDGERAGQLVMVINELFCDPLADTSLRGHATLLQALQAGVAAQLEPLSDAGLTGVGASSADLLGVESPALAGELTGNLLRTIVLRGARGGPLAPLASQLNQDVTHLQGQRIEGMIGQLAEVVREALARPGSGAAAAPARTISNLPARNPHFTGRAELLARLSGMLGHGQVAVVAVHGLGGIGKTQLAQEYARIHRAEYGITWWLRASNAVELAADFTGLARALGLDADPDRKDMSAAARSELASRSDWLLVFDNASDAELIRAFLPAGNGHVLITSRMRLWTGLAGTCAVDVLAFDEAVRYLSVTTGRDDSEITDLATELGCLPLALAQAAGYITVHGCSTARYLELYRVAAQRMLAEGPPPHGYPETVATTWLLHFESLPAPAIELLRLVSFLAPDAIPLDLLFATAPADSLPAALADAVRDPLAREAAIGDLVSASLLSRLDDHTVRVHGLVQEITRSRLSKRDTAIWTLRAVKLVRAAIPDQPGLREHWDRMRCLASHAQSTAMRVTPHQRAAYQAAMILYSLGVYLVEQEQCETARGLLGHALDLALFADATRRTEAQILYQLAATMQGLRDFEAADSAAKRSLSIIEAALGTAHPQLIQPLLLLAWNCSARDDRHNAFAYLDRVAEIYSTAGASIPPSVAWSVLVALGEGMRIAGEYEAAIHNLQGAMALVTELYGPDSHQLATVRAVMAWVRRDLGEDAAADAELSRAMEAVGAQFGHEHPFTRRLADRLALWRAAGTPANPDSRRGEMS